MLNIQSFPKIRKSHQSTKTISFLFGIIVSRRKSVENFLLTIFVSIGTCRYWLYLFFISSYVINWIAPWLTPNMPGMKPLIEKSNKFHFYPPISPSGNKNTHTHKHTCIKSNICALDLCTLKWTFRIYKPYKVLEHLLRDRFWLMHLTCLYIVCAALHNLVRTANKGVFSQPKLDLSSPTLRCQLQQPLPYASLDPTVLRYYLFESMFLSNYNCEQNSIFFSQKFVNIDL